MSDYIDRQAAIIAVNGVLANHIPTLLPQYEDIPLECARAIMKIPSAEVEPVKRGRWIPLEEEIGLYECSICGHKILRAECNYCPNCGAKMEPFSASAENGQKGARNVRQTNDTSKRYGKGRNCKTDFRKH